MGVVIRAHLTVPTSPGQGGFGSGRTASPVTPQNMAQFPSGNSVGPSRTTVELSSTHPCFGATDRFSPNSFSLILLAGAQFRRSSVENWNSSLNAEQTPANKTPIKPTRKQWGFGSFWLVPATVRGQKTDIPHAAKVPELTLGEPSPDLDAGRFRSDSREAGHAAHTG
jgi:hypothetical protein